jgi:hypothetical protein
VIPPIDATTGMPQAPQDPVAYWKWHGVYAGGAGAVTSFISDDAAGVSATALEYLVQRTTTHAMLSVRVTANTLLTTMTVQTYVNGAATGPSVAVLTTAPTGSYVNTAALALVPGDRVDVRVTSTGGTNGATLSAEVIFTNGSSTVGSVIGTGSITAILPAGISTIVDPNQFFTADSVGRSITITNSGVNNGTFIIQSYVGPTSVTFRDGGLAALDASGAVGSQEKAIITRWSQLAATPYSGNAVNQANLTSIVRVAEA